MKAKLIILVSCLLWLVAFSSQAAKLHLTSQSQEIGVGQQFQVDLMLDTEGEIINAIEGEITFSKELLEIREIRDGDSIINLWVERPNIPLKDTNINTNRHEIIFSGIIPTGFAGVLSPYYEGERPGKIFSLIFISKGEGEGTVNLENGKVLLHDGLGTPANVKISNFQFNIKDVGRPYIDVRRPEIEDKEPPEIFTPEIARDPNIFNGKYFLAFATQDKGTGISHYETQETRNKRQGKKWVEAESPYILKDQKLRSYIYVKAVDKAGNERMAVVEPRYPMRWYEQPLIWSIIILLLVILYIIGKILWSFKRVIH